MTGADRSAQREFRGGTLANDEGFTAPLPASAFVRAIGARKSTGRRAPEVAKPGGRDLRFASRRGVNTVAAMLYRRILLGFCAWVVTLAARTEELPLDRYATVDLDPAKTSIYIGSVTMTMPRFTRKDGAFYSTYNARVFPYFFSSEKGRLSIEVSDEALRRLEHGETVPFSGKAFNTDGEERRIEGRAVPNGPRGGKIKVRVFVSKKIELIFNTNYRFGP